MTLLSDRTIKSKKLQFVALNKRNNAFATKGSQQSPYQVFLSHSTEKMRFGDASTVISTLVVDCVKTEANRKNGVSSLTMPCSGNEHHTVCYHSLGAIKEAFKKTGQQISFYQDVFSALKRQNLHPDSGLVKVYSKSGPGFVWAVINKKIAKTSQSEFINLMRGSKDDKGID